ncbi:CAP domain-containing protein [Sagittula sp. MA-2]|uniref:CAP domain-containing protein n=1 Tax=Sagittula sp. MA-2 TaxID=3048007 RepID=UPI0024C247AB|nr:CAP domain-containing protein [Sagittula sp. MA-2]WHZ33928.1 CAP domain-containing protein [Sagittula sp. MA-2]
MKILYGLCLAAILAAGAATAQPVRQMLNGLRAEEGLDQVNPSPRLEEAAKAHALDMSRKGFFSHEGSDGSDVMTRVRRQGYGACAVAENIAKGQKTLSEVLGDWIASPPHRDNMVKPEVREYGLVRAPGDVWVLVLGRDGC